jgi:hypothetical protein
MVNNKERIMIDWRKVDWEEYERRVEEYEREGMSRSDAQGVVEAEILQEVE